MEFKKFEDIEIYNGDDLKDSIFEGIEKLLGTTYDKISFISSDVDDEVDENYYNIEGNSEVVERYNDMAVHLFSEVRLVLVDNSSQLLILFNDEDKEDVLAMF
jgi:hypothetical protein